MRLADKLLQYLHGAFDKDPGARVALRFRYDGAMTWRIAGRTLSTLTVGGSGSDMSIPLADLTIADLASLIAQQSGYSIVFVDMDLARRGAASLLDGESDQAASNGDALYAPELTAYHILDALSVELEVAKAAIPPMLEQLSIRTASADWLDEIGSYYGLARRAGEIDENYSRRIVADTLRPKGNNIAVEEAIRALLGGYSANVVDAPMAEVVTYWRADGEVQADGSRRADAIVRRHYGQFDVQVGFDLMSAESLTELAARVRLAVEGFRDAGTRMRQMSVEGRIEDRASPSTDSSLLSATMAEHSDERPPIRLQANGGALVGEAAPSLADGEARADGALMESGYTIDATAPVAESDISVMGIDVSTGFDDSYVAPALADGAIRADAFVRALGSRGHAIDTASVEAIRYWRANGLHAAGDGAVVASGVDRANGVRRCGAGALTAAGVTSVSFELI